MRTISRHALALSAALLVGVPAWAQDAVTVINQKHSGFTLPGVTLPGGHDEVRAADGTTCRSAVSGNGAYVDMGVIANGRDGGTSGEFSAYGRLIVPLGAPKGRVDCRRLYDLELERLRAEVRMLREGGGGRAVRASDTDSVDKGWANTGWSN